jgi:mgtE-like transporter
MKFAWKRQDFFKLFKEAFVAYSFNFGGLVAGFMIATQLGIFQLSPWAIAIYPPFLTAKGIIMGMLNGRLSTGLHLGTVHPRFSKNTSSFYKLLASMVVVTLEISVLICVFSIIFGTVFWGVNIADFLEILIIVMATMFLGMALFPLTSKIAFLAFKKGLNPDAVVHPISNTVADVFITLCYVFTLSLFLLFGIPGKILVTFLALMLVFLAFYLLSRNIHEAEFVRTIKESLPALLLIAFIVNITGTFLREIHETVEARPEIFVVYPAIIDMMEDVGAIVGSTATTKLALGYLKPSFSAIRNHATEFFAAWTPTLIYYAVYSAIALIITGTFSLSLLLSFTSLLLIANIIAVSAVVLVSFTVAILTFKKGLDPDNFVIPLESSFADGVTTIALFVALLLIF